MSYEETSASVAGRFARAALQAVVRTVWPEPCLACGREAGGRAGGALGLCRECTRRLQLAGPVCGRCGLELDALGADEVGSDLGERTECAACRRDPPPYRRLTWVWRYQPPFDAVILGLKFRRLDFLAPRLAAPMAAALESRLGVEGGAGGAIDAVVAVPLHWSRRLARGYDQAELIATDLARRLELPRLEALRRRRPTRAQSRQDRASRRANLRAAFAIRHEVEGLRLLLVDDVVTTGATLEAATRTLLDAGAASVEVGVAARTPEKTVDRPVDMP